jgi:HEPN domain-containing protein
MADGPSAEWLAHVQAGLDAAWSCARGERASLSRAGYLVQQAAEKLVKSALVASEVRPPLSHQIKVSCELLPPNLPFRGRFERLHRFTIFAFTFRYPADAAPEPEPTASDIDAWVPEIEDLKADFERRLEQRAGEPG